MVRSGPALTPRPKPREETTLSQPAFVFLLRSLCPDSTTTTVDYWIRSPGYPSWGALPTYAPLPTRGRLLSKQTTVEPDTSTRVQTHPSGWGVATMTSDEKLALLQTAVQTIEAHDFVSPQVSIGSNHQREKQEMEAAQTYVLQQAFPTIQTLVPLYNAKAPSYTVRLDTIGSFLKPQPYMLITQDSGGLKIAEVKFHTHGYDTTIIYKDTGTSLKLVLQNPQEHRFECLINGKPHWWQPLGPSKSVFELTEEARKRVALFVYAEGMAQRAGSTSGNHMSVQGQKIGEVHVMEDFSCEPIALQQTLFTAVVVVEQTKRRATSIANWLPPSSSSPGRSRQEDAGAG